MSDTVPFIAFLCPKEDPMSHFNNIPQAPIDPIFGLNLAFKADSSPNKVNLGVGAYRTEEGKPLVLNSVQKVFVIIKCCNFI